MSLRRRLLTRASELSGRLAEALRPAARRRVGDRDLTFVCPNRLVRWRIDTLLEKEPETLEWIDGFSPDDVLFDVGANIGLYTLYAAALRRCSVLAFEPEARNYELLCRNIALNDLDERARAYPLAVSDRTGLDVLNVSSDEAGGAVNALGPALDHAARPFAPRRRQGALAVTLDELVTRLGAPAPTHVKVDVDGIEPRVVAGMRGLLRDERLRSLSIELNDDLPEHRALAAELEAAGLRLVWKRHAAMFDGGAYASVHNVLFRR